MRGSRAAPDARIELLVAVAQPAAGVDRLKETLTAVSDPSLPSYGQHLSQRAVHDMVAPSEERIAAVYAHFAAHLSEAHMLRPATPNGDVMTAEVSIAEAEAALGCEYYEYVHKEAGLTALRTSSYSLPASVAPHVDLVAPTVRLPAPPVRVATASSSGQPDGLFNTPKSLRKLYGVGEAKGTAPSNRQAVTGFLGQKFHKPDLQKFYKAFYKPLVNTTMGLKGDAALGIFGGVEAMLDAEYITTLGEGVPSEVCGCDARMRRSPRASSHALGRLTLLGVRGCARAGRSSGASPDERRTTRTTSPSSSG